MRRLTTLAATGSLLALFQAWYVYLPLDEAAAVDLCRLNAQVDCYRSLARFGIDMAPFGVPVFAALAGLFVFQLALCLYARTAEGPRREAWLAIAGVTAFPQAGLALYVLLHDLLVAEATSPSAIFVAAAAGAACTHAVAGGLRWATAAPGLRGAALLAAAALAGVYAFHQAGVTRHAVDEIEHERESRPPGLRWPRFAHAMPRDGVAHLGGLLAETEILLFVDPAQPESRALMAEAAALALDDTSDLLLYFYAGGPAGAALLAAEQRGEVRAHLASPAPPAADSAPPPILGRIERARQALGVAAYPTALWRGGSETGAFRLADIIRRASKR